MSYIGRIRSGGDSHGLEPLVCRDPEHGDVTPKDAAGRLVGAVVKLEGIAFLAIITSAVTSTFVTRHSANSLSREQAEDTVEEGQKDPQLEQVAARREWVESLLLKLTKRSVASPSSLARNS